MAGKNMTEVAPITAQENEAMIRNALKYFDAPAVDLHDPSAVAERIRDYFESCVEKRLRPCNLGLYAALGLTRQDVSDILRQKNKGKVSPGGIDMIKKGKLALSAYRESLAMAGRLNPVTYIFQSKNFDGLSDTQTFEVNSKADEDYLALSQEDVQRRIPVFSED